MALSFFPNGSGTAPRPFVTLSDAVVQVTAIKQSEDGQGLIVRLYESQRRRGLVTLKTGFPLAQVWRTNLLEEDQECLETQAQGLSYFIKPYQILTLRLLPKAEGNL